MEKQRNILIKVTIEQQNILRGLAAKKGMLLTPYVTNVITELADRNNPKKKISLLTKKVEK